jgi:hypothetical protein
MLSIVLAVFGFLLLGSIVSYILGPVAIAVGYLAKNAGERKLGQIGIWMGAAEILLGVVLTIVYLLTGWPPAPTNQ